MDVLQFICFPAGACLSCAFLATVDIPVSVSCARVQDSVQAVLGLRAGALHLPSLLNSSPWSQHQVRPHGAL